MKKSNVEVKVQAHVNRVLIDDGKAVGVEFSQGDNVYKFGASKEVILSGGSINSPQILMLSGIGPGKELKENGIKVLKDVPGVGADLQDHPSIGLEYYYAEDSQFHKDLRLDRLAFHVARVKLFGTGMAAWPPSSLTGYVKSRADLELPDIQMFFRPMSMSARQWFPGIMPAPEQTFAFRTCHLRPESRGRVWLRSSNPREPVRIINNFLSTEEDKRVQRECFRIMRKIAKQSAFNGVRGEEFLPGEKIKEDDDVAIDAYVRETLNTVFHPTSTCRMGIDKGAVLDPELKVIGIENLRVVDASAMPDIVGGNLNATVIMMAEKASDMIRGKESLPKEAA
tara:strand:- start:2539 stop:3555 length:1017 start_codon:yes stop_codon:yes gene_type:complete